MKILLRLFVTTLLVTSSCRPINISGLGCRYPNSELEEVASDFADALPESFEVLDRTDVVCQDVVFYMSYGRKVAGETLRPGSAIVRARIKIASDQEAYPSVRSSAAVHEFMHLYLWSVFSDPCDHNESCGWDEDLIETIRNT